MTAEVPMKIHLNTLIATENPTEVTMTARADTRKQLHRMLPGMLPGMLSGMLPRMLPGTEL